MAINALYFRTRRPQDYGTAAGSTTINRRGTQLLRRVLNAAMSNLSGGSGDQDYAFVYTSTEPAFANAGVTAASVATSFAATINGVSVSITPAVSDTNACGQLAAAINSSSNALVQGFVTATNLTATLTLTSVAAGDTVTICGYKFTATNGTPAGVVSGQSLFTFDMSGSNAADATALATAINQAPGLSRFVGAVAVSNVVYLLGRQATFSGTATFTWPTAPGTPPNTVISQASTIVASGASLAASAVCAINACVPGVHANAITIAASAGGGTAAVLNTATRLAGGTGLNVVSIVDAA